MIESNIHNLLFKLGNAKVISTWDYALFLFIYLLFSIIMQDYVTGLFNWIHI